MPFYDLRCTSCNGEFNIRASIQDKTEKKLPCPSCGSHDLVTVYKAAPSIITRASAPECPNGSACGGCCRA